ncbi:MAG TPA: hypothetical protein VG388_13625 [Solirubrobacteraceae bacterium]|nr:hypothetical protein [Solirubrobacteraceae bacterium]
MPPAPSMKRVTTWSTFTRVAGGCGGRALIGTIGTGAAGHDALKRSRSSGVAPI